jgi:hypothetical protein
VTNVSRSNLQLGIAGFRSTQLVVDMALKRELERSLLAHGGKYDLGRLGAEIAYTIAVEVLALKGIVLREPSLGGKDLFSKDGQVVIQTRLLARTRYESTEQFKADLRGEMARLIRKLVQDFAYNSGATTGYAILTYVRGSQNPRSLIFEIPRSFRSSANPKMGPPGFEPGANPAV